MSNNKTDVTVTILFYVTFIYVYGYYDGYYTGVILGRNFLIDFSQYDDLIYIPLLHSGVLPVHFLSLHILTTSPFSL